MTPQNFQYFKDQYKNLTGKNADDDLSAFFSYMNMLTLMDMNDKLQIIRLNQKDPNAKLK